MIEERVKHHLEEKTFVGADFRFSRHVKSKTTGRWMFCTANSRHARISATDGLKLGKN